MLVLGDYIFNFLMQEIKLKKYILSWISILLTTHTVFSQPLQIIS